MAVYTDIDDPSEYFQTKLYTGTNNELVLTFDGNSDIQPNMIWTKNRGRAANHVLSDTVRGIGKGLYPDLTNAEGDTNYISAIGSDGYTIVATDSVEINRDDDTFVSWNWKESATAGMDIVSYTGNATARTISHSLSAVPAWMLIKCRSEDGHSWKVYHKSIGATKTLALQNTGAPDDDANYHGDTEPTSSVFTIGSNGDVNDDGETFIAFLFAEKNAENLLFAGKRVSASVNTGHEMPSDFGHSSSLENHGMIDGVLDGVQAKSTISTLVKVILKKAEKSNTSSSNVTIDRSLQKTSTAI